MSAVVAPCENAPAVLGEHSRSGRVNHAVVHRDARLSFSPIRTDNDAACSPTGPKEPFVFVGNDTLLSRGNANDRDGISVAVLSSAKQL